MYVLMSTNSPTVGVGVVHATAAIIVPARATLNTRSCVTFIADSVHCEPIDAFWYSPSTPSNIFVSYPLALNVSTSSAFNNESTDLSDTLFSATINLSLNLLLTSTNTTVTQAYTTAATTAPPAAAPTPILANTTATAPTSSTVGATLKNTNCSSLPNAPTPRSITRTRLPAPDSRAAWNGAPRAWRWRKVSAERRREVTRATSLKATARA
mmetsp:Transcript_29359/g.73721  ORF Transcript_29359/g.73721 Transcript_29359/m.73721 type:complete len:211 (+) Transcript_29359:685-1317(+)